MAHRRTPSVLARSSVLAGVVGAVVLGVAGPASAHVTVTPSTTAAGSYAVLTFSVGHGCEGSATTELTIAIPEQVSSVTPTRNAQWDVEKQVDTLAEPLTDSHGNTTTERVSTVTYRTDTPLPDGYRDTFELSLQLPDAEGATLAFPVVQTCQEGESAWVEIPASGQDADSLELPAPAFTLTATGADGHGATTGSTDAAGDAEQAATLDPPTTAEGAESGSPTEAVSAAGGDGADVTGLAALGLAALAVALGVLALVRQRRRA